MALVGAGSKTAFRLAALPVRGSVGLIQPLDATPKGANFYGFAGHSSGLLGNTISV